MADAGVSPIYYSSTDANIVDRVIKIKLLHTFRKEL
jgi:hypothetical protein